MGKKIDHGIAISEWELLRICSRISVPAVSPKALYGIADVVCLTFQRLGNQFSLVFWSVTIQLKRSKSAEEPTVLEPPNPTPCYCMVLGSCRANVYLLAWTQQSFASWKTGAACQ